MSNRTLVELNHDYCPNDNDLLAWAKQMQNYMRSGDRAELPRGVEIYGTRHHGDDLRGAYIPIKHPAEGGDQNSLSTYSRKP